MATTTQDDLHKTFLKVSGQQASALSDVTMTLTDVLAQVQEMRSAGTPASGKTPAARVTTIPKSDGSLLSTVASTVLKSGFGLAPLIGGLIGLFGGSEPDTPPPLVKYALPAPVGFQAAETSTGLTGVDYGQNGMARIYRPGGTAASPGPWANGSDAPAGGPTPAQGESRQAPQITVNVQAMDARSFLDRSNDIALAVRDAMLNMNAINDVVGEL